jgi:hypothetical protein
VALAYHGFTPRKIKRNRTRQAPPARVGQPVGGTAVSTILLHLGDWNFRDRYFRMSLPNFKEFLAKGKAEAEKFGKIEDTWDWLFKDKPKAKGLSRINVNEDTFFIDFNDPLESIKECLEELGEQT